MAGLFFLPPTPFFIPKRPSPSQGPARNCTRLLATNPLCLSSPPLPWAHLCPPVPPDPPLVPTSAPTGDAVHSAMRPIVFPKVPASAYPPLRSCSRLPVPRVSPLVTCASSPPPTGAASAENIHLVLGYTPWEVRKDYHGRNDRPLGHGGLRGVPEGAKESFHR